MNSFCSFITVSLLIMLTSAGGFCSEIYDDSAFSDGIEVATGGYSDIDKRYIDPEKKEQLEMKITSIMKEMSLSQKIGQLFIVSLQNENKRFLTTMDDYIREIISQYSPGGFIFFGPNIQSRVQVEKYITDLQDLSETPLFFAIDEEGGIVSRLNAAKEIGSTVMPSGEYIGNTGSPEIAFETGRVIGRELSSLGFNLNFAPVADVNTNPMNPVIGPRSYSSDPEIVSVMISGFLSGMQMYGISGVLKHFPGHGDTKNDSHTGQVFIDHDLERLNHVEFIPFMEGIKAGADGIMTAHIIIPQITGNEPATLSPDIITGILREQFHFNGLIITDALEMGAITQVHSSREAAIMAIQAGVDILLLPEDLSEAYQGIMDAVQSGFISEERIDESVRRILWIKLIRQEHHLEAPDPDLIMGCEEHQMVIERIRHSQPD